MRLAALLEAGRQDFLDALSGVTEEQAPAKPDPNQWSILECIEHVIVVEERHLRWIDMGRSIEPQRDHDRELRLFTIMRNQFEKREAPSALRPKGRFTTLVEAAQAFLETRDRAIRLVEARGDAMYAIGVKHPFFGPVNGAELVQLMDGHARRHADQIRALASPAPALPTLAQPSPSGKENSAAPRTAPQLAAGLAAPADPQSPFAQGEMIALHLQHIRQGECAGRKAATFTADGCILDQTRLAESEFESVVWKDVRLVNCDLANLRAQRMVLERVEFVDCRLAGLATGSLDARDVLILNSDLRYASLSGARFQNSEFEGCNWQDSDLRSADLSGTVIRNCDLARADLQGATLRDTDFRTSQLEGMQVGIHDLRGAIVEPGQAMILAQVLGLRIV
ncbi:DinB family protein [Paludibaculum fermentans]|uniref:DinB family protein n=1 Tax=Paludibaculum fermentans TaxID=1473598 RepID=A0A7S7SLR4_PALFE|nr:DinB family protein [Paludibaculum fermentans]QOY88731.1 DinB family protein [Paludibaculum fermentans]